MTDWNEAESRHLLIMGALERMDKLLPCPFCGQSDTVEPVAASQMFADMNVEVGNEHQESFAVVCSVWEEGCGASSGFMLTQEQATAKWNTRANAHSAGAGE